METILVTGGRGFIGSYFVDEALNRGYKVIDIDRLTYAASLSLPWDNNKNYILINKDINKLEYLPLCDFFINFAAESHVCNSLSASSLFIKSNVNGTHNLLELLRGKQYKRPYFIHISTDEVYGDTRNHPCEEGEALMPGNPYAASKAAAEQLVFGYHHTYGLSYIITRSSNNYGERQYPEKLISRCLYELERGSKIPVHGSGKYLRDWLYVKDNVNAIFSIIDNIDTCENEVFNIGANNHLTNLEVIETVIKWVKGEEMNINDYVEFIPDRLGQDVRYNISTEKLEEYTGWKAKYTDGLYKFI